MITNVEKGNAKSKGLKGRRWHYLSVKNLSLQLRGTASKNNGSLCCLNCLPSFRTKNRLESQKRVCKNKDFCNVIMPQGTRVLEFNQDQKY